MGRAGRSPPKPPFSPWTRIQAPQGRMSVSGWRWSHSWRTEGLCGGGIWIGVIGGWEGVVGERDVGLEMGQYEDLIHLWPGCGWLLSRLLCGQRFKRPAWWCVISTYIEKAKNSVGVGVERKTGSQELKPWAQEGCVCEVWRVCSGSLCVKVACEWYEAQKAGVCATERDRDMACKG